VNFKAIAALVAAVVLTAPAFSADRLKIGVINTMTGPGSVLGREIKDGMDLALEHLGGRIGGLPTQLLYEDDQQRPEIGRQVAQKLLEQDNVDLIMGVIWSNVLMAVHGPIMQSGKVMIGTVAGTAPLAGEQCNPQFFATFHQNDSSAEAVGVYLTKKGVKNVYLMAPNYQAGREMTAGFKRYFKGNIVGEAFTPLTQVDFATELTQLRNSKADAVFVFYPGGLGIQFVKQYSQAGLKDKIPLYSVFTVNNNSLPALGDSANGLVSAMFWGEDLPNEANKKFVSSFVKKYNRAPSEYAAVNYDSIMFLDAGVRGVKGRIEDKKAFIQELKKANFNSVRGTFKLGPNHFPIMEYHVATVVKDTDGRAKLRLGEKILSNHGDAYAAKCSMKY
jgi:branched-chain amino acid transport system substrate-binding protein